MRIHAISDLHLETGTHAIPHDLECDVIVAAGDIGEGLTGIEWLRTLPKPVVYVLGNHEYYNRGRETKDMSQCLADIRAAARGSNVTVLGNESAVIDGVRFLGATLWSDFGGLNPSLLRCGEEAMSDYRSIFADDWYAASENRNLFRRLHQEAFSKPQGGEDVVNPHMLARYAREAEAAIDNGRFHPIIAYCLHQRAVAWLVAQLEKPFDGPTVVVTHHHPSYESLRRARVDNDLLNDESRWSWRASRESVDLVRIAAYASDLDRLLEKYTDSITLWVAGHLHVGMDYMHHGVRVVCNPRGASTLLGAAEGFAEGLVVELSESVVGSLEVA